jgi:hypothetical protein
MIQFLTASSSLQGLCIQAYCIVAVTPTRRYKGRMHWGKNIDRAFLNPSCPINSTIPAELAAMTPFQNQADPNRMFEPPIYKKIKAAAGPDYYPGCDRDGKCVCTCNSTQMCIVRRVCGALRHWPSLSIKRASRLSAFEVDFKNSHNA